MPRKAGTGTKSSRQRIQFAYNADREMPIGVVFRYLIDSPLMSSREGKHKGLDAMSAFWKPFAYQACTDVSDDELKVLAREAMEALAHQIALISSTFGVEPPKTENTPQQKQLQEMIQQAVTAAMLNLVESGAIVMPQAQQAGASTTVPTEGVDVNDGMFVGLLNETTPTPVN